MNEACNVVDVRPFSHIGEIVTVKEILSDNRVVVMAHGDEEQVVDVAGSIDTALIRSGDHVRMDGRSGLIFERIPRPNIEELVLEEVPDITYEQIGGLGDQIEIIRDAVELPYLYKDKFREYDLQAPKGILLYGPPGCGKTLIAKAVANSLAKAVAEKEGLDGSLSDFLNIKGPELLNK